MQTPHLRLVHGGASVLTGSWSFEFRCKFEPYLSSILGELKVNLWDHTGIIVPQKGQRLSTLLLRSSCRVEDDALGSPARI